MASALLWPSSAENQFKIDGSEAPAGASEPFFHRLGLKKRSHRTNHCAAASGFQSFLQDAGADGVCHLKQVFLPDKAELGFVAVRKADRQLGRL